MKPLPEILYTELNSLSIFEQLRLEEALLRTSDKNWCLINDVGTVPSIVLGISAKPLEAIHLSKWQQRPIPVIKRFTGGGNVLVDHSTCFVTLIMNRCDFEPESYPDKILKWSEGFYQPIFNHAHFQLMENDYVFGKNKIGGNAQSIIKDRWLHHTSFLWDYSDEQMDYLAHPKKMPIYRNNRPHHEFMGRLKEHFSDKEIFKKNILNQLKKSFKVICVDENQLIDTPFPCHRQVTQLFDLSQLIQEDNLCHLRT